MEVKKEYQHFFTVFSWQTYMIYVRIATIANNVWCRNSALMITNDSRCWNGAEFIFVHNGIPGIYITDGNSIEPFVTYSINSEKKLVSSKNHNDIIKDFSYIRFMNCKGSWQYFKDSILKSFKRLDNGRQEKGKKSTTRRCSSKAV